MDYESAKAPDYTFFTEHFKRLGLRVQRDLEDVLKAELPNDERLVHYLVEVLPGKYDQKAAAVLSAASTWAYSDADVMARMLRLRGFTNNETISMRLRNNALLLDTTVHISQSRDRELVFVCFGGTDPKNIIQLLLDASAKTDSYFSTGDVHGGFFRAFLALWPLVRILLRGALLGYPIGLLAELNRVGHGVALAQPGTESGTVPGLAPLDSVTRAPQVRPASPIGEIPEASEEKLKALYIGGHSLGGALAVLAAAEIHRDPLLAPLQRKVRGIYTFGQPMVGDAVFAQTCDDRFGEKLFRHVYRRDVVPQFPPITMGKFAHSGQLYTAPPLDTGWALQRAQASANGLLTGSEQALAGTAALALGAIAWLKDQLPLFSWLPLPYSLGDHSPLNYLRTSLQVVPGSEFRP
ncbi:lipase family protein [Sorangium sp. So ce693]|uniref:lipase family protein n=1 Tax=Sorangium sp. So ce693 TaxID=3133318 RepID=UPI003F6083F6